MMFAAESTQRSIGWVIAAIVLIGFVVYVWFNLREARAEYGSEVELAPNRKPYYEDEVLENHKLNRSLMFSLAMLATIAIGLPAYWLAEPGRQENAHSGVLRKDATRGLRLFDANCAQCHGPGGVGGSAPFTLTDEETGRFVAQVTWTAPALTGLMSRFDEKEVRYILNYGRGVMPAWGGPGGGPMTEQQITELVVYLRTIQFGAQAQTDDDKKKAEDDLRAAVLGGVKEQAKPVVISRTSALANREAEIKRRETELAAMAAGPQKTALTESLASLKKAFDAEVKGAVDDYVARLEAAPEGSAEQREYGRYLFNNPAQSMQFSCARCHTKGFSYNGQDVKKKDNGPLFPTGLVDGGGFFGFNLTNGLTRRQFESVESHVAFIEQGSRDGIKYGQYGQGSGKMPGFGPRTEDRCEIPPTPRTGGPPVNDCVYLGLLTEAQVRAIVAYERSL